MRVAHLNLAKGYRGGERQTELLVRALLDRREVTNEPIEQVLISPHQSILSARLAGLDIEHRGCARDLLSAYRAIASTKRLSVVHAHEGRGIYAAWAHSLMHAVPYVATRRVDRQLDDRWITRRVYRQAACVAAVSDAVAQGLNQYDSEMSVATVKDSHSNFTPDVSRAAEIRRRFSDKWLVGNVAALDNRHKGQDNVIAVARELEKSHPQLHFLLIGGGKDEDMLRGLAKDLGNLSFTGFVDNVGDYLAALDLFILPSRFEGLGSILLDAMAASLPIVASRTGGVPEIVRDEHNGLLIGADDPEGLRRAIERLAADPELCATYGRNGQAMAGDYSPATMAGAYLSKYAQLA